MATGRRKCICQICTCGKHICPHRKRGTLAAKGLRNGDLKKGPCLQDERSKEEQSSEENGKIGAKAEDPCTQNVDGASESRTAKAKKVQSKGNGQSRWSARQVPKTKAIKHSDNLKAEGIFEHTTTHQRDFPEKTATSENILGDQSYAQAAGVKDDSWSKHQVPKTLPIRKPDNLKLGGSLDLRTTHGESYTDITPVEASLNAKQENENLNNGDRKIRKSPKQQRPKTSLRPEGQFQSETLYQKDFSPRKADPNMMTPKHRPASNLKPEGEMFFDPTSQDYNADIFQTKLENGQLVSPRPRIVRPQSHLKPPPVPIIAETTVGSDFKKWNVEKPVRRRPEDTLKHLSAAESIDENVLLEQIKNDTYHEDFKAWKVSRPVVKRPPSNLKSEGEFNFETTHHADYVIKEQKEDSVRESDTNVSPEPVPEEKHATFQEQEVKQPRMSPESEFTELKSEIPSPDILPDKETEDVSEIRQGDEIASVEDSASDEMLTWDQIRPQPIRPHSNLRQYGDMTFDTTNRREFIQRPIERVKGFRPQTTTKISGDMETTTTNQAMMKAMTGEKVNPIRPRSNLHLEEGAFNDETTSAREFQPWTLEKPKPIVHKSTLAQEGDMTFTTTHHTEFEPKSPEKVYPIRPKTTNKVYDSSERFDSTTTSRVMHPKYESEKLDSIRPETNLKPSSGSFHGETTNQREFQQWDFDRMSPIRPHTNMRQEGDMDFTTMNQVQFHDKASDRPQPVIHPTNLHVESGQFSNETTSQKEFQEWKLAKATPYLPKNNLTQEGDFDFTTVNQTQFFEKPIQREQGIKPKSSSKITGDFDGTTTNQVMYQNVTGERPQEIRPKTNMRLASGVFSDETTSKREFQSWEVAKPEHAKPKSSVKQEGDFDGTTTNQVMFKSHPYQKLKETRPRNNLHTENGKFDEDTTTKREFHEWQYSKPSPVLPNGNLMQEGDMDFTTSNQTDYGEKTIQRVEDVRPHTTDMVTGDFDGTTTNRSMFKTPPLERIAQIRHDDNLRVSSGMFNDETTAGREFVYRSSDRPDAIRPKPNLSQEGNFDFTTSNQRDFEMKPITKVSPIRPQTMTKLRDGDFYGTTTNQAMFQVAAPQAVKPIRPQNNLRPPSGEFDGHTTAREEYQSWKIERPAPVIYSDTLKQEGSMQFETTNRKEFAERTAERPEPIRPKTTTKIEGDIDATTTNQVMFPGHPLEKVHPIRQKDNLHLESGKFSDETTSKREFKQWIRAQPRTKIVKPLLAAGIRTQGISDRRQSNVKKLENESKIPEESVEGLRLSSEQETEGRRDSKQEGEGEEEDVSENELSEKGEISEQTDIQSVQKERRDENVERKTLGRKPTRDYGSKPMARVKAIVPVGNIKSEGVMDFSTTSKAEYTEKLEQSKLDNVRLKTDHEPWKLVQNAEEQFPRVSRKIADIPTRPVIHKRTTMNSKDGDVSAITDVSYSAAPLIKAPKRFKPSDNLKPENVPFEGDSTTRVEYKKWDATRSSPKKRPSLLKQEGEMQFSTTAEDYSKRELFDQQGNLKPRIKKPQEHLKLTGDMNLSTTTHSSYLGNTTPKTKNLRPKSSLKIGGDDIESRTGTPPSSFRQQADLTTDITKSTYRGNVSERTRAHRPATSQKVGEGQFESNTTTQSEFKALSRAEKTKPFKPESSHIFNGGSEFQGNTTYRCTYDAMKATRCPVLDLESNGGFKFKEEVNGHRFYLPLVHG